MMGTRNAARWCCSAWVAVACFASATGQETNYDVVIYGGTSAGIVAAVEAKRLGRTVVVIEPTGHLGGMTSSGLGWTDSGKKEVIGGLAREFYQRVKRHYDREEAWTFGERARYDRYRPDEDAMWTFEPKVAGQVFQQWLEEHEIPVVTHERLNRQQGVKMDGTTIRSITMESGKEFRGRVFIDATYEGDLMAAAGVTYTVGREANSQYGETINGVHKELKPNNHCFLVHVDPYVVPGDPSSGLVPEVHGDPPGEDGAGDLRIQAYCFRLCMTQVPENRVPFAKPADYDARRYELLLRNFEAGDDRLPLKLDMMPNGKTDTNNFGAVSTDNIGMNYLYPEATYAERAAIIAEHRSYQQGLLWTLTHHPRVPEAIRQRMSRWGLARDEFIEHDHWPPLIYVREARRMVSDYVVTEQDCRRQRRCPDSVGMGSYNMDSHHVQRYVTAAGYVQNEGDVQISPGGTYTISYRSIVPRQGEADNLLVPVCLSASHIAYGSVRMEPVFMILGQSAAQGASLSIECECSVQHVPYALLSQRLKAAGQVLE